MLERGLLATAVLLVLGVAYVMRDSVPAEMRRLITGSQEAIPPRPPSTPPTEVTQAGRPDRERHSKTARSAELAALNGPVSTTIVSVTIPTFPEGPSIRRGMSKTEVVRSFGSPDWKATWTESGILHESYTYIDHTRVTHLLILAGNVVSSRTGPASRLLPASRVNIDRE